MNQSHMFKKIAILLTGFFFSIMAFADLTGSWILEVTTDAGSGTPTFDLVQDGEKVTGKYAGQLGEADVEGTVDAEGNFSIVYEADMGGQKLAVSYSGKVSGDTMEGKLDLAGMGGGTFTGKKQ